MNFSKKKKDSEEKPEEDKEDLIMNLATAFNDSRPPRVTGVYGDINEEKCSETIFSLLILSSDGLEEVSEDGESTTKEPIDFYVSTFGGVATEMFSVYDMMRKVRDETPIHTHGIGKVMSAGVLLLAAGTKGERRIGKNCRVMIHGVISGQQGHLKDVENEFEEAKLTQKLYIRALAEETDMTERYIKKLMDKKTNVYLDAVKAVELGIADIVF